MCFLSPALLISSLLHILHILGSIALICMLVYITLRFERSVTLVAVNTFMFFLNMLLQGYVGFESFIAGIAFMHFFRGFIL